MRTAVAIALLLTVAACSSGRRATSPKVLVCGSAQSAYAACAYAPNTYETTSIFAINRTTPKKLVGGPPGSWDASAGISNGFWVSDRVFSSDDGRVLLAQWSGECEGQSTYLISTRTGRIRPVFKSESRALGWSSDGRARVFLAEPGAYEGEYAYKPGVYLVDRQTMKRTLVRAVHTRHGC